jgi:hypothetical protein
VVFSTSDAIVFGDGRGINGSIFKNGSEILR